jgi:hypothetical protein
VENQSRKATGDVTVFAPLQVRGLPDHALLWADRAVVRLKGAHGQVLFLGRGDDLKTEGARAYEAIRIPALLYEANKDRPLTLEIDYWWSVLAPGPILSAPALGADLKLGSLGRCTSGRDEDGDEIALRCTRPGRAPSCLTTWLDDPAAGRRNPEARVCSPDYAPIVMRPFPDALSRFEVDAPFRDRLGVAAYPVGGAQLASARIVVQPYRAVAHGRREVNASGVRLASWTAG